MNVLDKLIATFSPEAGVRRASARQMLDQYEVRYAAARHGRRNKGWKGRATSANVEVGGALVEIRNRAREFVRDSWAGQRILDVLTSHVVGTGITISANTGSDKVDARFNLLWEEWQASADIERVMDFGAMQAMAVRSMVEGGDSVLRFIDIDLKEAGRTVPFRVQGLEGDQIDTTRDRYFSKQNVRLGVQLGDWGRREGLWLHKEHPGDMTVRAGIADSSLIDWDDLCHVYRPLRFGQVRGITWFAPVLLTGREMQDLTEAAIVQARTQASFAGFLHRQPGGMNPLGAKKDEEGNKITQITPGMIADIGDAEITFANPSSQSSFGEVYIAGMQAMAAGAGITYDQLTGDLRQANYSSLRAGKIEFRRLVEQIQWHLAIPRICLPTVRRFTQRAILAGMLPDRRGGYPVDAITPAIEPIDPKKDLEADILAVRAGRLSPQEFVSAWGHDWRKVVSDHKKFWGVIDESGIALDIDPRRPNGKGLADVASSQPRGTDEDA